MAGEEVVQLYIDYSGARGVFKAPVRSLKGFQRISLKAGETRTISFRLNPEQLSLVNKDGALYQPKGKLMISVGGGQPGQKIKASSNTIQQSITIL